MIKLLLVGLAAVLSGSAAFAADMAVKAPPVKAVAPSDPWTGCYLGGNVGAGWARTHFVDPAFGDEGTTTFTGVVGGGQAGCDYQAGPLVFGIAGQYDGSDIKGRDNIPAGGGFSWLSKFPWFATFTGRAGYLVQPSLLLYVKGGAAWMKASYTLENAAFAPTDVAGATRKGGTFGGGLEYAFAPHWSAFVEYDYMGFGTQTLTAFPVAPGPSFPVQFKQNMQVLLIGANFRFGLR